MMNRVKLHDQQPTGVSLNPAAWTGQGFMPDLASEGNGVAHLHAASKTLLEIEGPAGQLGMMPAAGPLTRVQNWLKPGEEGVGGPGSFVTATAYRAGMRG